MPSPWPAVQVPPSPVSPTALERPCTSIPVRRPGLPRRPGLYRRPRPVLGHRRRRARRAHRRGWSGPRRPAVDRPRHRSRGPRRTPAAAGFPGRPRAPRAGRHHAAQLRPARVEHRRPVPAGRRRVRRRAARGRLDHGWRLEHGGVPGRHAAPLAAGRRLPRPPGRPAQPRRPRPVGQQPRAGDRRHHRRDVGPGRRPDRARRRRHPDRHVPGGRRRAGDPAHTAAHRGGLLPGPAGRPGLPALLRHHRLAGRRCRRRLRPRRRLRRLPAGRPRGHADRAGPRRAVVEPGRRAGAAAGVPGPPRRGRAQRRALPGRHRQDHAGRRRGEPHRGDAGALPGRLRLLLGQRGHGLRRPRRTGRLRRRTGRGRVPGALPRAR